MNPLTYFIRNQAEEIKLGVVLGQNLGQIRPNVVEKVKKWALSIVFFLILHGEYLLKQKIVVYKPLNGNLKKIQREVSHMKDVRANFLPHLGQKWQKTDYFQELHFSLPVLKSHN